jgi:trk system potassium uptake protein TrkH
MNIRRFFRSSERLVLYSYFVSLILAGTLLLSLPVCWSGAGGIDRAAPVDAFFTAVSATCVTGLITVDTSLWSRFGQVVILLLIQAGGLGIITFGMLYLVLPKARISLKNSILIRESFVAEQTPRARQMLKSVFLTTILVEIIGALLLILSFVKAGTQAPVFEGIFHAVSAFCNAGFSVYSDGLVAFRADLLVNFTLTGLIVVGGIGFLVIRDIRRKVQDWRKPLLYHSKIMLFGIPLFIIAGTAGYLLLDTTGTFSSLPPGERILAAFFQSVTTRTAGFNTVDQASLSVTSRWLTFVLMLVGGGSGSTAGGIKVTTAIILFIVLFRGVNEKGDIRFFRRRISSADVSRASMFFLKAISLLFLCILLLGIIEHPSETGFTASELVFESVSAIGTVGLSMGITSALSIGGKLVIAATMFAGRVGLFSLVIRKGRDRTDTLIEYPKGEVLIG